MEDKEIFIKEVMNLIENASQCSELPFGGLSLEANRFFEKLKNDNTNSSVSNQLTEKGKQILEYMQNNYDSCSNMFNAKSIGEGLSMAPRSVSGSMRKLVSCRYVEKSGTDPVTYSLVLADGVDK